MTAPVTAAAIVSSDAWLTGVIGAAVFRVNTDVLDGHAGALAEAIDSGGAPSPALYYANVPAGRVARVHALEAARFHVVETAVTFVWQGPRRVAGSGIGIAVADLAAGQAGDVLDIAGSCFRYSRFHTDPRVPVRTAHRVKREWIQSYVDGRRGERLLVAAVDGRPAGFLAALTSSLSAGRMCVIDLVGVAGWAQRRGVGTALVQSFLERYDDGRSTLQVGTQIVNLPSIHLYQGLGFVLASSQYVLHRHVGALPEPASA